jgi:hypothetical protein
VIFHHSIPALAAPLRNKSAVIPVLSAALAVSLVFYCLVGGVVSFYFGDHVRTASNLNWSTYVGALDPSHPRRVPGYATAVSVFVVLFPAFDVASAYPLNAITLGNNLFSLYRDPPAGSATHEADSNHVEADADSGKILLSCEVSVYDDSATLLRPLPYSSSIHAYLARRYRETVQRVTWHTAARKCFRLLASVPPILGAACVSDLGVIANYAGVSGFALAFVFPGLLALAAERCCVRCGVSAATPYSHPLTGTRARWASVSLGVFLMLYVLVNIGIHPYNADKI